MKFTAALVLLASSAIVLATSVVLAQQAPPSATHPVTAHAPASSPPPSTAVDAPHADATHTFEGGVEYVPLPTGARVTFNLQDAELPDLIRAIGNITGKRFIIGTKVRSTKTTVFSPTPVTPAEAYQAFLSILDTNGLTAIPEGRYVRIENSTDATTHAIPTSTDSDGSTADERFVTRIHRLRNISADDAATLLAHFRSHDGDITPYAATRTLIITDTGANIRRMLQILGEIDVPSIGEQIWFEPLHYANAHDVADRLNEMLNPPASGGASAPGAPGSRPTGGDGRTVRVWADDRTNALLVLATEQAYLHVLDLVRAIDIPVEGEGEGHVYYLQHADADELAATLTAFAGSGGARPTSAPGALARSGGGANGTSPFESPVHITADKRTNALLISSTPRDYTSLRHMIEELDRARRQVFIEAVVMEIGQQDDSHLGISWHGAQPTGTDGTLAVGGFQPAASAGFPGSLAGNQDALTGLALGIRGPILAGTSTLIPGMSMGIPEFGAVITAAATNSGIDVLATPSIVATDNAPADINVGQNIALQNNVGGAVPTSGTSSSAAPSLPIGLSFGGFAAPRQDVGTKIHLVPHINDANEIRLEIDEEISEAGEPSGGLGVVPINRRAAKTTVVVRDQQTIVIGGLVRNAVTRTRDGIPILSEIPLIGALFRTDGHHVERRNLVLFLTPYIIRDQSDLRAIFERKMRERQEFLDRYLVFSDSHDYHPVVDYSRTNGLVEEIRQAIRAQRVEAEVEARANAPPPPAHSVSFPIGSPIGSGNGDGNTSADTASH